MSKVEECRVIFFNKYTNQHMVPFQYNAPPRIMESTKYMKIRYYQRALTLSLVFVCSENKLLLFLLCFVPSIKAQALELKICNIWLLNQLRQPMVALFMCSRPACDLEDQPVSNACVVHKKTRRKAPCNAIEE